MGILKFGSYVRETGINDRESWKEYLKMARPLNPVEDYEMTKEEKRKHEAEVDYYFKHKHKRKTVFL